MTEGYNECMRHCVNCVSCFGRCISRDYHMTLRSPVTMVTLLAGPPGASEEEGHGKLAFDESILCKVKWN